MRRLLALVIAAGAVLVVPGAAQAATGHVRIEGTGSWAASEALTQWSADVRAEGLQVDYTPIGDRPARFDFGHVVTDFAVTGSPFTTEALGRAYAYVPLAGTGTAFAYRIILGGRVVRDLRLSPGTLREIFAGRITDWSDPAITADNNGRSFPTLPITTVGPAQDAAETDLLTSVFGAPPAPEIKVNGYDGVANNLTSRSRNGAIGYLSYAWALRTDLPVVKVRNVAGSYVLPADGAVAVALTRAQLGTDLMQDLSGVPTNPDARAYPFSSYVYAVVPTGDDARMTSEKRQTLADFLDHALCRGQAPLGVLGYAPLPTPLVRAGYEQLARLGVLDPRVTVPAAHPETCGNPMYDDRLLTLWPTPAACDRQGAGPCLVPGEPDGVPLDASNDSPPYTGAVSLRVDTGAAVRLAQVDPATAAGHPAQGGDPTGHRHAWVFTGTLGGVAVDESRPGQPGWTLTGQATDFTSGATVVPGRDLGWVPAIDVPGSDAEGSLVAGPAVPPALQDPASAGLGQPGAVLASVPAGSGLGLLRATAGVTLWMPDTAPKGTYTATLTLTLISG
ncbi:substrate-binding domain-containing protein [Dactylosporangium sp. AC04546]|uniref:substrate-binding domain-containing protein n=1 Tax=Dactylosporangium sp. AC04546 TaxID=2862460 RepID=UPI001EDDBB32|nr:substrate-binding domain-containing protein [Dactylosporangium sp. AC04546]WVK80205.1 substrate-binding domain-containing protein [Dactylosporangium sp. AC04546]